MIGRRECLSGDDYVARVALVFIAEDIRNSSDTLTAIPLCTKPKLEHSSEQPDIDMYLRKNTFARSRVKF